MKTALKSALLLSAMAIASAAQACEHHELVQGAQLNPAMKAAFQKQGTIISIFNHTYVVAKPASCYSVGATEQACRVGLLMPELHRAFTMTGPKGSTNTVIPLSDVMMQYTQSTMDGYALNVTNVSKA